MVTEEGGRGLLTGEGHKGTVWGTGNVLYLYLDHGYMGVHIM